MNASDLLDGNKFPKPVPLLTEILRHGTKIARLLSWACKRATFVYAGGRHFIISYETRSTTSSRPRAAAKFHATAGVTTPATVNITPRSTRRRARGRYVQIGPNTTLATLPIFSALYVSVLEYRRAFSWCVNSPCALLISMLSPADAQLSGPVGIAQMVAARSTPPGHGLWFLILVAVGGMRQPWPSPICCPAGARRRRLLFILIETLCGRRST